MNEITLGEYCETRQHVVVVVVSRSYPCGDGLVFGHPDIDDTSLRDLLGLDGHIDDSGVWQWDGEGEPIDEFGATIYQITAAPNETRWHEIADEYLPV